MSSTILAGIADLVRAIVDNASPSNVDLGPAPDGNGRQILIRDGYKAQIAPDQVSGRQHRVDDLPSLLAYLARHGSDATSTLFCHPDAFTAVLDDNGRRHGPGAVTYHPKESEPLKRWLRLAGGSHSHVKFKDGVEDLAETLVDKTVLAAVMGFSARTSVAYDADLEDGESVTFKVEAKQGNKKGVARLPKVFDVRVPVLQGWAVEYLISFRLVFDLKGEDGVTFKIEARNLQDVLDQAMSDMVAHGQETLGDGWLVVRGKPVLGAV